MATETKLTPGPWFASECAWPEQIGCCPLTGRPYSVHGADSRNVAAAITLEYARLIAAAPDMLVALDKAFDFLGGVDGASSIRDTIRAAIAKAEGSL